LERLLEKIADKLLNLDEASLTCLWNKYFTMVQKFEPTKRWEKAVIILSLIQAVRWKNQLFNIKWLELTKVEKRFNRKFPMQVNSISAPAVPSENKEKKKKEKGKIIFFNPKKNHKKN